ncbi:MAG: PepSY domain-containing protein [Fulvivirga sp.]
MRKNRNYYIRKTHRYLGIIIGIQFLFWTISGLYFSWTDIDEIHGDHFLEETPHQTTLGLAGMDQIDSTLNVSSLVLKFINGDPYYWVNDSTLIEAKTGSVKHEISKEEAIAIAEEHVADPYKIKDIQYITEVDDHHEYRGRPLPAWAIGYEGSQKLTAYVSAKDGSFQRVRHRDWRWFDFLWMTHTMDYESRDDFNNWLLRSFSAFGLLTVLSGFVLFYISSPTVRKIKKIPSNKSKATAK